MAWERNYNAPGSWLLMNPAALECRLLTAEWSQRLLMFLRDLEAINDGEYFHPHPFTDSVLDEIIQKVHDDLYYILVQGNNILGYGMLRGWDEGYEIPSLGIAIHPQARGQGLGKLFMRFLSAAAKRKGATKIRLRVKPGNATAIMLYKNLGYRFEADEAGLLVGFLELNREAIK
jgi:ribosomal-protein-alanine N-acetyltransferase